ncbi:hypothetical protein [Dysgonomonas sp. 520]|uniref:hypothetical protein n=1 Tax=Dysgonomonas sp. 520 TaxID=2302931 RepID=UPI00162AD348|nr:hypothetical protein [Dysgonomonas sp. 520]
MSGLDEMNKKNPFNVPENYFEKFNAEIMSRLPDENNTEKRNVTPLWKKILPISAVAAAFVGVLVTVGFFNNKTIQKDKGFAESESSANETMMATTSSASEADDFYLFLQDEARNTSYYETFAE